MDLRLNDQIVIVTAWAQRVHAACSGTIAPRMVIEMGHKREFQGKNRKGWSIVVYVAHLQQYVRLLSKATMRQTVLSRR